MLTSVNFSEGTDFILSTHNTLMLGGVVKVGPYLAYERLHSYVTDMTMGAALRIGEKNFLELQGGAFKRSFRNDVTVKGKGMALNAVIGLKLSTHFSLSLLFSAKKIDSGLNPRSIYKVLPYLGVSFGS